MSEVKTSPLLGTDANGDPTYTFTSAHTFGDVARWIASEGGAEDVAFMLSEAALTRTTPDQTAALDKLIADAVEPYVEALLWCSGSADFNEGGVAEKGWRKLCAPLLAASKKGGA